MITIRDLFVNGKTSERDKRNKVAHTVTLFYGSTVASENDALAQLQWDSEIEEWQTSPALSLETFRRRVALGLSLRLSARNKSSAVLNGEGCCLSLNVDVPEIAAFAYHGGRPIGVAALATSPVSLGEGDLRLWVEPEWRRRGIAADLLKSVLMFAKKNGIGTVRANTLSHVPAGRELMSRLGASARTVVRHFQDRVGSQTQPSGTTGRDSAEIRLELFDDYGSDSRLVEIAVLKQLVATRFGTDGARINVRRAASGLAHQRKGLEAMGIDILTIGAVLPNGSCIGFSEYLWDPEQPHVLKHVGLAVDPIYQGGVLAHALANSQGLVLSAKPSVSLIRYSRLAGPAMRHKDDSKAHHLETRWRVDTDAIQGYVGRSMSRHW